MRTLFNLCVSFVIWIGINGCESNILDQTPETNITDGDFWRSANDAKLYANSFYNSMLPNYSGWGSTGIYGLDAVGSDNMIGLAYNISLNGERVVPGSGGGYGAYGDWAQLRMINYFLVNYPKIPEPLRTYSPYVGEAYFFRAFFYFDKLKMFGAVPWVNVPLTNLSSELYGTRLPRNVIADSILHDLDKAIAFLPTRNAAEPSRITKELAMLFQARIALYEGTWERYHAGTDFGVAESDGRPYIEKAATVAEELLNNPAGYALARFSEPYGYWNLFNQTNYTGNTEVMLWRAFSLNLNLGHRWHRYTIGGAGRGMTKDLVDAYLCTDGLPIALSAQYQGDETLLRVVTNRDPRLRQTLYVDDGAHIITNNRPNGQPAVVFRYPTFNLANEARPLTGYQLYKGHNPDYNQQQDLGTTGQIIFRFAEAHLIFAEARAELGQFTQADADRSINLLRRRVNMPDLIVGNITRDPRTEFPALSPLLNEIRRERRVELACEGYRQDDLFRWAAMAQKIRGIRQKGAKRAQWETAETPSQIAQAIHSYPIDEQGYIDYYKNVGSLQNGYQFNLQRDYLSPLPLDQLSLNPGLLPQNPGW